MQKARVVITSGPSPKAAHKRTTVFTLMGQVSTPTPYRPGYYPYEPLTGRLRAAFFDSTSLTAQLFLCVYHFVSFDVV